MGVRDVLFSFLCYEGELSTPTNFLSPPLVKGEQGSNYSLA